MDWFQNIFNSLSTPAALIVLIVLIGGSVVLLRALIRLAMRTFLIGVVGLALLGALYYLINHTNFL